MGLLTKGILAASGLALGQGIYLYQKMQPHFEIHLKEDYKDKPFITLERQNDKSYFEHITKETDMRIRVSRSLFNEFHTEGPTKINLTASLYFKHGDETNIEKYLYASADTFMGIPIYLKLKKDGENKGAATAYIDVERHGPLKAGIRYYAAASCYKSDGRNYFTICQIVDDKGNPVRTYRARFVKIDWFLKTTQNIIRSR